MATALKVTKAFSATDPGVATTAIRSDAGVIAKGINFTEDGAGTYTGTVDIPAGAIIRDVVIHNHVLWTAAVSASLEVGDAADPDGFFTAVNLKATDLLAGESISFAFPGGQMGADVDADAAGAQHVRRRRLATARVVTATVVSSGAGTAGRTQVVVEYVQPTFVEATKA